MSEVEAYSRLAGVYDELVVDPCFASWATFLVDLWRSDPEGVHRVLDVCCGTGLMAAELVDRGHAIVGIDASQAMLTRARGLLGSRAVLSQQTLPELHVEGTFDAAISTFDGLNYLTLDEFQETIEKVACVLRPGGWLVFDLHTDAMLAMADANPVITGETDGHRYTITNVVDLDDRTCDARIVVASDAEDFSERHLQYFHSVLDVRSALADAGFMLVDVLDEYTPEPVTGATLRATWVARRIQ